MSVMARIVLSGKWSFLLEDSWIWISLGERKGILIEMWASRDFKGRQKRCQQTKKPSTYFCKKKKNNKLYWSSAITICLFGLYGDRDQMAWKTYNVYYLAFLAKVLPTPGLEFSVYVLSEIKLSLERSFELFQTCTAVFMLPTD